MSGKKVIDAQLMDAHITSDWFSLRGHTMVSYQIFTEEDAPTADHVGTITFEVTNDTAATGKEIVLDIPQLYIPTGSEYLDGAEITDLPWTDIRVKYTRTSGGTDDRLTVILAAE